MDQETMGGAQANECNIHYVSYETASTSLQSAINPPSHTSAASHDPMPPPCDLIGILVPPLASPSSPSPLALAALRGHNGVMGREENRKRLRLIKQLTTRLHREPTDDEIEKALARLQEIHRKMLNRRPIR